MSMRSLPASADDRVTSNTARACATLILLALAAMPQGIAEAPVHADKTDARTFYLPLGATAPMRENAPTREDPLGIGTTFLEHADAPYVRATDRLVAPLLVAPGSSFELHLADREALAPASEHTTRVQISIQRPNGTFVLNPDGSTYLLGETIATVPAASATAGTEGWSEFRFAANDAGVLLRQGAMLVVPADHRLVLSFGLVVAPEAGVVVPDDGRTPGEFYRDTLEGAWGAFEDAFPGPVDDLGEEIGAGSISRYLGYWLDVLDGTEDSIDAVSRPHAIPPAASFRTRAIENSSWLRVASQAPPIGEIVFTIGFENGTSGWAMPSQWSASDGCLGSAEGNFSLHVPACGTMMPLLMSSTIGSYEFPFQRGFQNARIEYSFRGTPATLPPRADLALTIACVNAPGGAILHSWTSDPAALADPDGNGFPEEEAPTEWTRYSDAIPACQGGKMRVGITLAKRDPSPPGTDLFALDAIAVRAS